MIELRRKDETTWQFLDDDGETVLGVDIEIMAAGIAIEDEVIPWSEIDVARKVVQDGE